MYHRSRRVRMCSKCSDAYTKRGQYWCPDCINAYQRTRRIDHYQKLSLLEKRKLIARTTANNAVKAGKLPRKPCRVCGDPAQMHHGDYRKPLAVEWLCREHHEQHHIAGNDPIPPELTPIRRNKRSRPVSGVTMHDLAVKYASDFLP